MKKILSILASLSLLTYASTAVIACGGEIDTSGDVEYEKDEYFYELFGKQFSSKEDAINYYLSDESGLVTETQKEYVTNLFLNESKFNNSEEMIKYIDQNIPIKELTTNKNVESYLMDGMNQLSANVVQDENEEVKVYRDVFGNAVYNKNDELAKQEAEESYQKDIQEKYYLDKELYNSKNEVTAAYMAKLDSAESIEEQDLYTYDSLAYKEDELKDVIQNTIKAEYTYNGSTFLDSEINMPNIIDPTYDDKAKIKKYTKSPGKYLVEARSTAEGTYTGDLIINSPTDITNIIHDASKWEKGEETSENIFEVVQSTVVSAVVMSAVPTVQRLEAIIDEQNTAIGANFCFGEENKFSLKDLVNCYSTKEDYEKLTNLLEKYELLAESEYSISNVNNIESLEVTEKAAIYLYQMRESFRNSNISYVDNLEWNQIGYNILSNFLIGIDSWTELLEIIGVEDVFLVLDYLVDKTAFFQVLEQYLKKDEIKAKLTELTEELELKLGDDALEKQIKDLQRNAELIGAATGIALEAIAGVAEKALSQVPILGAVIDFFKSFSLRQTVTYKLILPGTENVLTYEMSKWFFEDFKFDPEEIFRVFEIKEPKENETYLVDGRYFPTYDLAYEQLLKNIVAEVVNDGPSNFFSTAYINIKRSNKQELIEFLYEKTLKENRVENKFTDFFGGIHDTRDQAINSLKEKLKDESNLDKYYFYQYGKNNDAVFITKEFQEMKDFVKEKNVLESKVVSVGELISNTDFDSLYDLSEYSRTIYTFNIYGMDYYYMDIVNAYYGILKILNYRNVLFETKVTTYSLNDIKFENKVDYVKYLNDNIVQIESVQKTLKGESIYVNE